MDIDLMVLNVGNSRLAIGIFSAGSLEHVARLPLEPRNQWAAPINQAWSRIANKPQPAIAAASVNAALNDPLESEVLRLTNHTIEWVGDELDIPIGVHTKEPRQTGVDRVLNMAAAYEQIGKACVVVDAGTAITVDCCDDRGDFLGGAIAPGLAMMLDALHEKTAALPRVAFEVPTQTFGDSTATAIRQGVYHGVRGMEIGRASCRERV